MLLLHCHGWHHFLWYHTTNMWNTTLKRLISVVFYKFCKFHVLHVHSMLHTCACIYMYMHESSVGLSSTTNPKPRGKPSHCLLRQTYMYVNSAKDGAIQVPWELGVVHRFCTCTCVYIMEIHIVLFLLIFFVKVHVSQLHKSCVSSCPYNIMYVSLFSHYCTLCFIMQYNVCPWLPKL